MKLTQGQFGGDAAALLERPLDPQRPRPRAAPHGEPFETRERRLTAPIWRR